VLVDDEAKQATVIVPDDQLSLAIGREGQNARLAARLTGWRVDIRSETEFAAEEAEHGYEEEEVQGRCAAVLSNGRRCPNASLPGSRYCGLETHQALASIATDNVADLNAEVGESAEEEPSGEEDVAALAHDGETDAAPGGPAAEGESLAAEEPTLEEASVVEGESLAAEEPALEEASAEEGESLAPEELTLEEAPAEEPAP
jgi:N utilization substance protein A